MTKDEQQFNQWFDEYADGVKVFEEADMKQAFLAGYKAGFETCAQSRLNVTTVSDCPIKDGEQLEYAKTIIKDLLDNSDEYARERAINFLKENE